MSLIIMILFITGTVVAGAVLGKAQLPSGQASEEMPPVETPPEEQPQAEDMIKTMMERLQWQKTVDKTLQTELESGNYTFEEPLVVLDPYDESPLTALVLFRTETATQVEITIPGDDEDTGAVHTFAELSTWHVVPVYGLYPAQVNTVTLKLLAEDGQTMAENQVEIETEPLPDWLDYIILTESYQGDYAQGLNYMTDPDYFAFDKGGKYGGLNQIGPYWVHAITAMQVIGLYSPKVVYTREMLYFLTQIGWGKYITCTIAPMEPTMTLLLCLTGTCL